MAACLQPALAAALGHGPHASDVGGALGDRNDAARIQQVEAVRRLDALVIGRKRQIGGQKALAFGLGAAIISFIALLGSDRSAHIALLALLCSHPVCVLQT